MDMPKARTITWLKTRLMRKSALNSTVWPFVAKVHLALCAAHLSGSTYVIPPYVSFEERVRKDDSTVAEFLDYISSLIFCLVKRKVLSFTRPENIPKFRKKKKIVLQFISVKIWKFNIKCIGTLWMLWTFSNWYTV